MGAHQPDVVVVGAGIAGASIAAVLARGGIEVLLLERQREYRDRVRGEYMAPWGVVEARALGLERVIRSTQAVDGRYRVAFDELIDPSVPKARSATTRPSCPTSPDRCAPRIPGAVRRSAKKPSVWERSSCVA